MTKITLVYHDGTIFSQIFVNFCDVCNYINTIKRKCKETDTPFPEIFYDEWEMHFK